MAFTINQVRQLYVAKALKANVGTLTTVGDILPKADTAKTTMYFQYMSPGGITSSDKVTIKNVTYAKATSSTNLAYKLKRFDVTLDSTVSATPVAGLNYLLRLAFRQYIGLSEEDQYFKYGEVQVYGAMTASEFYKQMALSLVKNMSKETAPLVNIYLVSAAAGTVDVPVTSTTKESDLTKTDYNKIVIEETQLPWILGTMPQAFIPFTPQFVTIEVDGMERIWGKSTVAVPKNTVLNGHMIADLEYFCAGAKGDIYRGMGYPNTIKTTYVVDPSLAYDTLDIHYYYEGSNESVQKSEKTITLVAVNDGTHTVMNALIGAINTASGLAIATL